MVLSDTGDLKLLCLFRDNGQTTFQVFSLSYADRLRGTTTTSLKTTQTRGHSFKIFYHHSNLNWKKKVFQSKMCLNLELSAAATIEASNLSCKQKEVEVIETKTS